MSLDLQPGDEIITSDFTFAATVEVIALLKLKPVLVDIDEDTFIINCNEISKAITSKTKAIIPVHLFGQVANMDQVMKIAESNNLFVIEDNAQAIGAVYNTGKKTGTIGHLGTTSFFPSKAPLTEGGARNAGRLKKSLTKIHKLHLHTNMQTQATFQASRTSQTLMRTAMLGKISMYEICLHFEHQHGAQ